MKLNWRLVYCTLISLGIILMITQAACGAQKSETPTAQNPKVDLGKKLFNTHACFACHQIGKGDQPTGPDLTHVTHRRTDFQALKQWILKPDINSDNAVAKALKAEKPKKPYKNSTMVVPPPPLTDAEADALVEYLKTLH